MEADGIGVLKGSLSLSISFHSYPIGKYKSFFILADSKSYAIMHGCLPGRNAANVTTSAEEARTLRRRRRPSSMLFQSGSDDVQHGYRKISMDMAESMSGAGGGY
jgi:hypothetical protein